MSIASWSFLVGIARRKELRELVNSACSTSSQTLWAEAIVKNGLPGHSSESDSRPHVTVWLKTAEMKSRGTHQPVHIYLTPGEKYQSCSFYPEKRDLPPPRVSNGAKPSGSAQDNNGGSGSSAQQTASG